MSSLLILVVLSLGFCFGCEKKSINGEDYFNQGKKFAENLDFAEALRLYEKGCEYGNKRSCSVVEMLNK
jgi:hypothetical protein